MQKEQIKNLLVNIIVVAVVAGLLIAGYFVLKGETTVSPGGLAEPTAESTANIGAEIERTVTILETLAESVKNSAMIFSHPAFKSLENLSAEVPTEVVGRENPFTPTEWRLENMKKLDEVTGKASVEASRRQTTAQNGSQSETTTNIQDNFLGDFDPGDELVL